MKKTSVIVMDYDGTMTREGDLPDHRVLDKIKYLKDKGILTLVATARPYRDIESRFSVVGGLRTYFSALVLELGAVIYLAEEDELIIYKPPCWDTLIKLLESKVEPANQGQVLYYFDQTHLDAVRALNKDLNVCRYNIVKVGSATYALVPFGVDKGIGLTRWMKHTKILDAFIISIGDSNSDLPLFRVSNYKGAVGNASKELKEAADLVAYKENGEGLIEILEKIESLLK